MPANYRKIAFPEGMRGYQFPVVLDGGINPITVAACTLTVRLTPRHSPSKDFGGYWENRMRRKSGAESLSDLQS